MGLLAFGAGSMGVALLTALTPAPVEALGKIADVLDRAGLDKGPLLMFGVLSTAMGFALSRLEKASRDSSAASDAADFAQSNASSIELQGEILGSVQGELSQIRHEIALARHEAAEARQDSSNGEASDPLFRLAASLDQLGAQIDKRIDKARREMVDAISGVANTAEVSAQQREEAFKSTAGDIDSVRMDIADLRAQLTRVSGEVSSTKEMAVAIAAGMPAQVNLSDANPGEAVEPAPTSPALPRELTDDIQPTGGAAEPTAPMSSAPTQGQPQEPQYDGFQHRQASESENEDPAPARPALGVDMDSLGFPEPPAPMPKPSEGLTLIDEMDDDTARLNDMTPPLFPDV